MKHMRLFYYYILLLMLISCAAPKKNHVAEYSFEYKQDAENNMAALFLSTVTYQIITDGKMIEMKAQISKSESDYIRFNVSGPTEAVYDITNNLLLFSRDSVPVSPRPVLFKETGLEVTINGYTCKIFVNEKKDTVFLTDKLPYYINPFFLNDKSIKHGVVKASLSSGIYTLNRYFKAEGKLPPLQKRNKVIHEMPNVFFK